MDQTSVDSESAAAGELVIGECVAHASGAERRDKVRRGTASRPLCRTRTIASAHQCEQQPCARNACSVQPRIHPRTDLKWSGG